MLDDLHPDDERPGHPRRVPDGSRPQSDREVPIGPPSSAKMAESLHAWLDGEGTESAARRAAGSRDVELWKRIEGELMLRRRQATPPGLESRIMVAIPMHAPQLVTPWWRRELVVSPSTALLALATVMAVAAAATVLMLR